MVSQSFYGFHKVVSTKWFLNLFMVSTKWFPLNGFSIFLWFPLNGFSIIIWLPLNGFSIIIWYPKIWFLNHHMVLLYGFSIKKMEKTISFPFYGKTIFFNLLDSHRIFNLKMVPIKKSLNLKMVPIKKSLNLKKREKLYNFIFKCIRIGAFNNRMVECLCNFRQLV